MWGFEAGEGKFGWSVGVLEWKKETGGFDREVVWRGKVQRVKWKERFGRFHQKRQLLPGLISGRIRHCFVRMT